MRQEVKTYPQVTEWYTASEGIRYDLIRPCLDYSDIDDAMLILGDCRSGTTSLAIVMARLGIPMGYQEDKAALRCLLAGMEPEKIQFKQWVKPESIRKTVGSKSTIGGGQLADCLLNPLKARLHGPDGFGIPSDNLSTVLMARNPFSALESWKRTYSDDFYQVPAKQILENFLAAQYTLAEAQHDLEVLQQNGSPLTFFAQELLNYRGPEKDEDRSRANVDHTAYVVHTLMTRSAMPFEKKAVYEAISNWPQVTVEEAHKIMHFPDEPPYNFKGAILSTFNSGSYSGRDPSMKKVLSQLTLDEIRTIYTHGLTHLYNDQLDMSIDDLGLNYADYEDLFIPSLPQILTLRESTL